MPRRELSRFRQLLVNWTNEQTNNSKPSTQNPPRQTTALLLFELKIQFCCCLKTLPFFDFFRCWSVLGVIGALMTCLEAPTSHKQFRTKHTYKSWERLGGRVGTSGTFQDLSGLPAAAGDKSFYFCHLFKYENSAYYLLLCNLLVILKSLNTQIYDAMRNFIEWIKLNKLNWSAQNVNFFHSSDVVLQSIK